VPCPRRNDVHRNNQPNDRSEMAWRAPGDRAAFPSPPTRSRWADPGRKGSHADAERGRRLRHRHRKLPRRLHVDRRAPVPPAASGAATAPVESRAFVRGVIHYERAIETKNVDLFRAPGTLERRRVGFGPASAKSIRSRWTSSSRSCIDGRTATSGLARTVTTGGRRQTNASRQTFGSRRQRPADHHRIIGR
jgi:hypothetical protein